MSDTKAAPAYARMADMIAAGRCVILDGGIGTELPQAAGSERALGEPLWGARALIDAPDVVQSVHARYLEAGCDVITTNTWGLATALSGHGPGLWDDVEAPVHWMDVARRAVRLAHRAVSEHGRAGACAVAFSLNADVDSDGGRETIRLLTRLFADEPRPPDLILLETLSVLGETLDETVQALLDSGLPVWLSFRRCRHGLCGVYGQHWGGPEGDAVGRAAHRYEAMGVGALLINCIPPDHADGMISYLRDFTDLPLGVYPNLGYFTDRGWSFDVGVGGEEYAGMALRWREEGAQIIGGCCGVRPEHIAAARERVRDMPPGDHHGELPLPSPPATLDALALSEAPAARPWTDERGRRLYPLQMPEIVCDPDVFVPTQGSFLMWKHLFREGIGDGKRCIDIGCGTGLLAIQLALNGAEHVHAIDIDRRAVANTLANAGRNGVADRMTGEAVDLYPWVPKARYDVLVASLYQMPVDPYDEPNSHRPLDFWGRNLLDHLITLLPTLLEDDGVAYLMQLSILSQTRTADLLAEHGFSSRVVDFAFFTFHELFHARKRQIERVEELSDAYHLRFKEEDVMVAYLLEVRR